MTTQSASQASIVAEPDNLRYVFGKPFPDEGARRIFWCDLDLGKPGGDVDGILKNVVQIVDLFHIFRSVSVNGIMRSILPLESRIL